MLVAGGIFPLQLKLKSISAATTDPKTSMAWAEWTAGLVSHSRSCLSDTPVEAVAYLPMCALPLLRVMPTLS